MGRMYTRGLPHPDKDIDDELEQRVELMWDGTLKALDMYWTSTVALKLALEARYAEWIDEKRTERDRHQEACACLAAMQFTKEDRTMSRIPELMDDSASSMYLWWKQMATAGLAFHPDDDPYEVGNFGGGEGEWEWEWEWTCAFTDDEAFEVQAVVALLRTTHGDEIYRAALQATEEPDITRARQDAIATWAGDDIQVSPYAEVEKVDGGYWAAARVWVSEE